MPAKLVDEAVALSRGRSARHILLGVGLTAGAVALSALVARMNAPQDSYEAYSDYDEPTAPAAQPRSKVLALIWPPLFMTLTVSALRIWNAPASAARTQALTLWGALQTLNAVWMALGPRRLGGQLAAAVATFGTAAAYALRARAVDAPAGNVVDPYVGLVGLANVLSEEFRRKPSEAGTLH